MRIAHLTATFPPYQGGTGMVAHHNAMGLAALGHDVTVITANHPPGEFKYPDPITVRRLPVAFRIGNAPFLPELFRLDGYDIVHVHYPFVFGQEIMFLKSFLKTRYVITYHQDLIFNGMMNHAVNFHHAVLGRFIISRTACLMMTSVDYGENSLIGPIIRRINDKVMEMPNGVDTLRFHPNVDAGDVRSGYGIGPDDKVMIFVGGLDAPHYFKGVEILLQAIKRVDYEHFKVMIVGDGDLRPRYIKMSELLGLTDRVTFCGRVSDEMLPAHYAAADFHVLPSLTMGEAFGIVLLEAMATGKPVIASNLPGVRSVVDVGEDGFVSTPNDVDDLASKIRQMLDLNDDKRAAMGMSGRAKVERKYAWPQIIEKLEKTYKDVLAGKRS